MHIARCIQCSMLHDIVVSSLRWCKLPYLQKPSKVVVIVIQNMAVEDIKDNAELFTFLKANFDDVSK